MIIKDLDYIKSMTVYDKFISDYTTGKSIETNLNIEFENGNVGTLNIGALNNRSQYGDILKHILYGKVLDVGAGIGRHSRLVPNTYSLDNSKACCDYLRSRGFNVIEADILDHNDKYDSLILTMNNMGMCGDYETTLKLIKHLKSLLKPKGQIIFDFDSTLKGRHTYKYKYSGETKSKTWTFLSRKDIDQIAKDIGMHFEIVQNIHTTGNEKEAFILGRFYFDTTKVTVHATSRSGHNHFMESLQSWMPSAKILDRENSSNVHSPSTHNIVFMRDLLNTAASASKVHYKAISLILESWKYLLKEGIDNNEVILVEYEKFIDSEKYRRDLCKKLGGYYNESRREYLPEKSFRKSVV